MLFRYIRLTCCVVMLPLLLVACDTAEERAEKHYQNAVALLEKGDIPRALVELKIVFDLIGKHRDARAT